MRGESLEKIGDLHRTNGKTQPPKTQKQLRDLCLLCFFVATSSTRPQKASPVFVFRCAIVYHRTERSNDEANSPRRIHGQMGPGSVAVLASAPEVRRNGDSDYEYRQDTDFYFLTRFNEPGSVAVLAPSHPEHKYVLFVRPKDREQEIWTGVRAGVEGAVAHHGAMLPTRSGSLTKSCRNTLVGTRNSII